MKTNDTVTIIGRMDLGRIIAIAEDNDIPMVFVEFSDHRGWYEIWRITGSNTTSASGRDKDHQIERIISTVDVMRNANSE